MMATIPLGTRAWRSFGSLDPLDMLAARRRLSDHAGVSELAELDDDTVLELLRDHDEHLEDLERREQLRYLPKPPSGELAFEHATELRELADKHRVSFLVLDGRGEPFPGVAYELFESGSSLARGSLGDDGTVRRDSVTHDDYALVLVDIEEVRWIAGGEGAGAHALEIDCSGIADGTRLDVLVFEELREADGEELAKLTATVQGNRARAEWTADADELATLADEDGRVRIVAEVRGPQSRWRKTDAQLELVAPTVLSIAWGETAAAPIELVVATRGVADGTPVRIEIWHARLGAAAERLAELGDGVVVGDGVRVTWSPPALDHAIECWATATIDGAAPAAGPLVLIPAS